MKKKNFVKLINAILAQTERERKLCEALEPYLDGDLICTLSSQFQNAVLAVLEDEMNDPCKGTEYGSIISWWLYDTPDAGKNKDSAYIELPSGFKYTLETAEQLYDYLIGESSGNTKRDSV